MFDNRSGSTFRFADDQDIGAAGDFFAGLARPWRSWGPAISNLTVNVDFDGPVNINAGTLSLGVGSDSVDSNGGAVTLANGTTFAIGVGGFGTHSFAGAISDGANSATVTNASGNQVTFSGDFSVQTLTNTGNLT